MVGNPTAPTADGSHGAVTQGAESGPRAAPALPGAPNTQRGAAAPPRRPRWRTNPGERAQTGTEEEEGHTCRGEHGPAPNTLCNTEANYPNLQLEASGKRLSLKDN